MSACEEHAGRVCETCGAWVLWGYVSAHKEFHEQVTILTFQVNGICPACSEPYDDPPCEASGHAVARLDRMGLVWSARRNSSEGGA